MPPLFGILPILVLVLGIGSLCLLLISNRNKRLRTEAAFSKQNAMPTVKIQDLWIDPKKQKWAIAKESIDVTVYSFSDIDKVELIYDGETYVKRDGVLKTQLGGMVFGALTAAADEVGGEQRKTRMSGNVYIHIYLSGSAFPLETLILLGSPVKSESSKFRKTVLLAEKLMHTLNAMKDGTYNDEVTASQKDS